MKTTLGRLKRLIRETTGLLTEIRCAGCGDENEYAEPNQPDGKYICRSCRQAGRGKSDPYPPSAPTKPSVQPPPDAGPYKVLEDDGHGQMSVHIYRDKKQFTDWMMDNGEDFDEDDFDDAGQFVDADSTTWSEFTGHYEHDHRKDP
jgi:hypothetical protein